MPRCARGTGRAGHPKDFRRRALRPSQSGIPNDTQTPLPPPAGAMSAPVRRPWLDWLPLVGMIITIAGLIWMGAQYAARVDDTVRRIGVLEDRAQRRDDMLATIDARLARIEGRLDALREQGAR